MACVWKKIAYFGQVGRTLRLTTEFSTSTRRSQTVCLYVWRHRPVWLSTFRPASVHYTTVTQISPLPVTRAAQRNTDSIDSVCLQQLQLRCHQRTLQLLSISPPRRVCLLALWIQISSFLREISWQGDDRSEVNFTWTLMCTGCELWLRTEGVRSQSGRLYPFTSLTECQSLCLQQANCVAVDVGRSVCIVHSNASDLMTTLNETDFVQYILNRNCTSTSSSATASSEFTTQFATALTTEPNVTGSWNSNVDDKVYYYYIVSSLV
jgi:hypothetical protein